MQNNHTFGLRYRLTALVLLAVLPVLGLIIYTNITQRQIASQRAEEDLQRLSGLIAADLGQYIEGGKQLLMGLGDLPEVRNLEGDSCSEIFFGLIQENSRFHNLRAILPDGTIYCSGLPSDLRSSQAGLDYFQRAVNSRQFTVGEYQIFTPPGVPVMTFAQPFLADNGQVQGVVTAIVDLSWFDDVWSRFIPTSGSMLTIIDRHGTILNRQPDGGLTGKSSHDSALIQTILSNKQGSDEMVGLDGVKRIYAYTPVEGSMDSIFVAMGVPSREVYAAANQNLVWSLVMLALVTLLALFMSWWFGKTYIIQPIIQMTEATRRLSEGDLSARSRLGQAGELGVLAKSFDQMAEGLELRSQALLQAEANYRTLVEQLPAVAYRAVPDGFSTPLYISPQLKRLVGYDADEWMEDREAWSRAIHPDDRERVIEHLKETYQAGEPFSIEYRIFHKDGSQLWIRDEGVLTKEKPGSPVVVHGLMQDITDRRELLEILRHERDTMSRVMETSPAGILLFDQSGKIIYANQRAESILGTALRDIQQRTYNDPAWKMTDENGEPVDDDQTPFRQAIQAGSTVSQIRFNVENPATGPILISANAVPLLDPLGNISGVVASLEDITEQNNRLAEMEALVEVAAALRTAESLDSVIPVVLTKFIEQLKVDGASLGMRDPVSGDIVFRMGLGAWTEVVGSRLRPREGITASVVESGQPYWNNDIQKDAHLNKIFFSGGLPAGACLPLNTQEGTIGVIWIGRRRPFQTADVRVATGLADIAANAVHRAALLEETRRRLQQISSLHSIDMAITSTVELQVVLNIILDEVLSQLKVEAADILLMNPEIQVLTYAAGRGLRSNIPQAAYLHLGEGLAGQTALNREMTIEPDLSRTIVPEIFSDMARVEGVQAYFAAPLIAKSQVKGVLELFHRQPFFPDPEWVEFLNTLATQAAIAIDNSDLFARLQRSNEELTLAYDATIKGWSEALELRDQETRGHADRVTDLAVELAEQMGMRGGQLAEFRRGVLLHDVGKMGIPDTILLKEGPLSEREWETMRQHPEYAYRLLSPIPYLRHALDVPYSHHEWWDGSGYPKGLKGTQIPLGARIFAVIDVWDALTNDRPYRKKWDHERVRDYISSLAGIHFDPEVVVAFFKLLNHKEIVFSGEDGGDGVATPIIEDFSRDEPDR